MDEIVVDMSREKGKYHQGQAYVALSLVTTYKKLHIVNYDRNQIKVSPHVEDEMKRLRLNTIPSNSVEVDCEKSNCTVKIAHVNIRGIKSKLCDITNDNNLKQADIICFNETRLNPSEKVILFGKGTKIYIYRCDRNNNGGGVMIALINDIKVKKLPLHHPTLEIIGVQVNLPDPLNIISIYRRPGYSKTDFICHLCDVLNDMCEVPSFIVGDFNEDLLDEYHKKGIHNSFTNVGFTQHVKVPTMDTGSLIDHVYTSKINNVDVKVIDSYYTDHDIVFSSIKTSN